MEPRMQNFFHAYAYKDFCYLSSICFHMPLQEFRGAGFADEPFRVEGQSLPNVVLRCFLEREPHRLEGGLEVRVLLRVLACVLTPLAVRLV